MTENVTTEELLEQLDALVGLDDLKREVRACIADQTLSHFAFVGGPGTGKTTAARLVADLLCSAGLLSKGQVIGVSRFDLVSIFIGHTAAKTQEQINRALGGVLLVDEAHLLAGPADESGFGREALCAILRAMDEHRDDLVVILEGYPEPMQRLFDVEIGLARRVKIIEFPNYTVDECLQVLDRFCGEAHLRLTDEAREAARAAIELESGSPRFSNGRFVRNLFDKAAVTQSRRIEAMESPTDEARVTLTADDFVS